MKIIGKEISVEAEGFSDIVNITDEVEKVVRESGFSEGLIHIPIGSTASISTIEFEPALVRDMRDKLEEFAPHDQKTRYNETWGNDEWIFTYARQTCATGKLPYSACNADFVQLGMVL